MGDLESLDFLGQSPAPGALDEAPGRTVADAIRARRLALERKRAEILAEHQARQNRGALEERGLIATPGFVRPDIDLSAVLPRVPVARRPRPAAPAAGNGGGALEIGTQPWEGLAAASASENDALARSPQTGALDGPQAAAPREGMGDRYARLVAGIPRGRGASLTPEQKAHMQMDFFMNLLARGSKPGARFLGALGESGLDVSSKVREQMKDNVAHTRFDRSEARDDVFRQMGFEDKDIDNQRAARQLGITEEHYRAMDARDKERLKLAAEQLAQGNWEQIKNAGTGTIVLRNKTTREIKDTGIKYDRPDNTPAELRVLRAVHENPALAETFRHMRGLGEKGGLTEEALARIYGAAARDTDSVADATERASRAVEFARRGGQPPAGAVPRFNTPRDLEAAIKAGIVKKGDRVMTPTGERVVR